MKKYNQNFDYHIFYNEMKNILEDIEYLKMHFNRVGESKKYNVRIIPITWNSNKLFEKIISEMVITSVNKDYIEKYFLMFDIIQLLVNKLDDSNNGDKMKEYVEILNKFNEDLKENWNCELWKNIYEFNSHFSLKKCENFIVR